MFSHLKLNIRNLSFICKLLKPALRCSAWLSSRWAASSPGFNSLHLQAFHSPHALTQDIWHPCSCVSSWSKPESLNTWVHHTHTHHSHAHAWVCTQASLTYHTRTHACVHIPLTHTCMRVHTHHSHTHEWVCTHAPPTHTSWHWVPWKAFLWIGHCLS